MREFSIKEFEHFSDIKAHTIRIWEQRYSVLKPKRTDSNIRLYNIDELKLLLNISLLIKAGYKISDIVSADTHAINEKAAGLNSEEINNCRAVNHLIISMFSRDIETFENILDECLFTIGINNTLEQVIIPFLSKVQLLSYKDKSSEAHFVVTAVRKKLILGIEFADATQVYPKTALFFLPKNEHYDLTLLYMTYIIKRKGLKILYLGTDISNENLELILSEKKPDFIYTYLAPNKAFEVDYFSKFMKKTVPLSKLFVGRPGNLVQKDAATVGDNVHVFYYKDIADTITEPEPVITG